MTVAPLFLKHMPVEWICDSDYWGICHPQYKLELSREKGYTWLDKSFPESSYNYIQSTSMCNPSVCPVLYSIFTARDRNKITIENATSFQREKQVLTASAKSYLNGLGTTHDLQEAEMIVCGLRWFQCGLFQPHAYFQSLHVPQFSHSWVNSFHLLQIQPCYLFSEQFGFSRL